MEKEVKDYLSRYFNLPIAFFREKANLYTLAMLSEFFKSKESTPVSETAIDCNKLNKTLQELPTEKSGRKIKFLLNPLLKNPAEQEQLWHEDEIGPDGFTGYNLEVILCIMEMPEELEKKVINQALLDNCITIGDFLAAFKPKA